MTRAQSQKFPRRHRGRNRRTRHASHVARRRFAERKSRLRDHGRQQPRLPTRHRRSPNCPNAEIAYICDCEENAIAKGIAAATSNGGPAPKGIKDFRQALDDKHVDALICAAPNHWHAPATIIGLAAGKHVYCEKPASHTADEGERMIAAAKSSDRVLQIGLQRRSNPHLPRSHRQSPRRRHRPRPLRQVNLLQQPPLDRPRQRNRAARVARLRSLARPGHRRAISRQRHPLQLASLLALGQLRSRQQRRPHDRHLPLGPRRRLPHQSHRLRQPSFATTTTSKRPTRATSSPTSTGRTLVWEGISWSPPYKPLSGINIELRGDAGAIFFEDSGYRLFDADRKLVEEDKKGNHGWAEHLTNFIEAVRNGAKPNCPIEEGHKSTMLCHLGNIAYRTGQPLDVDPSNGHIKNSPAADKLWACEYRKGWFPGV